MRRRLRVHYRGRSEKVYFDICDLKGKIIKTGSFSSSHISIDLNSLLESDYIFLLMDGKDIRRIPFTWNLKQSAE